LYLNLREKTGGEDGDVERRTVGEKTSVKQPQQRVKGRKREQTNRKNNNNNENNNKHSMNGTR